MVTLTFAVHIRIYILNFLNSIFTCVNQAEGPGCPDVETVNSMCYLGIPWIQETQHVTCADIHEHLW